VIFPSDVAATVENLPGGSHATVAFGGRGEGDAAVFLAFEHGLWRGDEVEAAFVVVQPAEGAGAASGWVDVEARDVPRPFDGARLDWSRRPPTDRPAGAARTRGAPGVPLRIDVTPIVRRWVHHGHRMGRIALVARAAEDVGATFSTGLGQGPAPRLEVYLR
jgi:hypothetical protein